MYTARPPAGNPRGRARTHTWILLTREHRLTIHSLSSFCQLVVIELLAACITREREVDISPARLEQPVGRANNREEEVYSLIAIDISIPLFLLIRYVTSRTRAPP